MLINNAGALMQHSTGNPAYSDLSYSPSGVRGVTIYDAPRNSAC